MAENFRPLRRLAPVAFALATACGSPSSPKHPAGEGGPHEAAAAKPEEPLFENGGAPPARDRTTDFKNFFTQRGVSFETAAENAWVEFGGEGAVVVTIRNSGNRKFTLLGERTLGTWPFGTTEQGRLVLHVRTIQASLALGVQDGEETRVEEWTGESSGKVIVEAGATHAIRLPIPRPLAKDAVAARLSVRIELHPLAVQFEGEPDRVVALPLAPIDLGFAPPRVALGPADRALFEHALAEDPELVVGAALRVAESGAPDVVARLIAALPGPDAKAMRARFVALEWLTGKRFGGDVERWRGWWESEEGMRFGHAAGGDGQ